MLNIDEIIGKARKARSLMTRAELAHLCSLAEAAPNGTGVEIGVFYGASLIAWSLVRAGRGESIGVDDWTFRNQANENPAGAREVCVHNLKAAGVKAILFDGDSSEVSKHVTGDLAFLFIDGDHHSPFIDNDIARWTPKIMRGGVAAFHDYGIKRFDTTRVIDAWAAKEQWRIIGRVESTIGFMRP